MRLWPAAVALLLSGCDAYHFHAGRLAESREKMSAALAHYESFLAARPADPRSAELQVRAGKLYAQMKRCDEARLHFEAAARQFPHAEPWTSRAKAGVMSCPDYFPLDAGRIWVFGDSVSQGRAMKQETESRPGLKLATALFAGNKKLKTDEPAYEVSDWTLWQKDADGKFALLKFPFSAGRTWTAYRGKRKLIYTIEKTGETVRVTAGRFDGCLKVKEVDLSYREAWKYDYYCPGVGRALTTVAGKGFENPNTELLTFR